MAADAVFMNDTLVRLLLKYNKLLVYSLYGLTRTTTRISSERIINIDSEQLLENACRFNSKALIDLIVKSGVTDWNYALYSACQGGHLKLAEWAIEKGATNWNYALQSACQSGHREFAEWAAEKGANCWNHVLQGACLEGY